MKMIVERNVRIIRMLIIICVYEYLTTIHHYFVDAK